MNINPEINTWELLSRAFAPNQVRWRIGRKSKKGDKAMPLAYIDARDVMDRLDGVMGPDGWQSSYTETVRGRVICSLSLNINGEWITKSDGAGDTQVEGEKGAISDAFKRAAVHWGIGRYLYAMDAPWVAINDWGQFTPGALKQLEQTAAKSYRVEPPAEKRPAWIPAAGQLQAYEAAAVDKMIAKVGFRLSDVDAFCDAKDRPRLEKMAPEQLNQALEFFLSNRGAIALQNFRGA